MKQGKDCPFFHDMSESREIDGTDCKECHRDPGITKWCNPYVLMCADIRMEIEAGLMDPVTGKARTAVSAQAK